MGKPMKSADTKATFISFKVPLKEVSVVERHLNIFLSVSRAQIH